MSSESVNNLCIYHILDGLRFGLSHYSDASRAALAYALKPEDPIRIYDPQDLLRDHAPKLEDVYLRDEEWRNGGASARSDGQFTPFRLSDYQFAGLITCGGSSPSVFHQMWFTEQHPDMCNIGPTQRWLECAAGLLSMEMASGNALRVANAGRVLQQFASHAVRDFIVDARDELVGMDTYLRIYPILDAVLAISKTPEEGSWPRGKLGFVEPSKAGDLNYLATFPPHEQPLLNHHKHVRKLLQCVEYSGRTLISDGRNVVGVALGRLPRGSLVADFKGSFGFLYLDKEPICSFFDGSYQSTNRRANLVQLEESLLEIYDDPGEANTLFRIVSHIVNQAAERRHGCALVLDMSEAPLTLAGQNLAEHLDLRKPQFADLAQSLSKVDGALHIDRDMKLRSFACLMDGRSVAGENRARGARFNSALRFTAQHDGIIVVVVSSDRPVSVIQHGMELTAKCVWKKLFTCVEEPPTLEDYLKGV